ncbi:ras-domain-containing protein [Viridothelium virens]|uniref:Ras-domain-containing protein n=1 Tax=Viridothelium virens TaxID=1048519 RepID=A0A6A6HF62_VIRVR|nr:ras-domain-containing protein [Viridothelium virens]
MVRKRTSSRASTEPPEAARQQELSSMYDYLAKIILIGPSGTGKSCLLHRFVKNEWRILSSQTIGVEFASKIVKVGNGPRRKRVKLQLWDTAGTERFRSVSRSYYRGSAGAIIVYDVASHSSFRELPHFLNDARALASPQLTVILAGNKSDLADEPQQLGSSPVDGTLATLSSSSSRRSIPSSSGEGSIKSNKGYGLGSQQTATIAPEGREVIAEDASRWASSQQIPVSVEVSALSGENVEELFSRLAGMILTKIELGEINPDDPQSGIQYGDSGAWGSSTTSDGGSIKSTMSVEDGIVNGKRKSRRRGSGSGWMSGMREWEEVFSLDRRRRRNRCC